MTLPTAEALSLAGMSFLALFGAWKLGLQPRLERRRARRAGATA